MMNVPRDEKTEDREVLSKVDLPNVDQLAPVEMGRADRETKGGFFGSNDFEGGLQP